MERTNDQEAWLDALPVAAVRLHAGAIVGSNPAARALVGGAGSAASVAVARFLVNAAADAVTPWLEVPRECVGLALEVAIGEPLVDGSRIVVLRESTADDAVRRRLERGLAFERLLTRSSADLMRSDETHLDDAIEEVLGTVGRFFDVDRAYVFRIDDDAGTQSNTHEWTAPGISREAPNLQAIPLDTFPWLLAQLRRDSAFTYASLDELPPDACNERAEFEREGIRSILIAPLWSAGVLRGFIGFDAVRRQVEWSESYVVGLRLLAQMLAGAIDARAASRALRRQAMHDPVTGLPNRLFLHEHFERCVRGQAPANAAAVMAVIDVDDFKVVNDRFGHACGDALLRELGRRLEEAAGPGSVVARLGGDEFVVMKPHGRRPAHEFADVLLAAAGRPFEVTGGLHRTGVSIGLVRGLHQADDLDTLLDRADAAMYQAKAAGKNRWAVAGGATGGVPA